MSLFHPPNWFPPQLTFLWPMIWVQVLMLRAQIRAAYGRGVRYRWSLTPNLRVYLVRIEWMPGQKAERAILKPATHASDRLAAACDGRAAVPEYLRVLPLSLGLARKGERTASARARVGVRGKGISACAMFAAAMSPLIPNPFSPGRRGSLLPLPET